MYPTADTNLTADVWRVMQTRKGYQNRIQRDRLTLAVFGRYNDSLDRKVRDALSNLPVVWSDGYFVPTSIDEAEDYIAGMRSRQAAIGQRLRVLDDYLRRQREPVKVQQMQLMEGWVRE